MGPFVMPPPAGAGLQSGLRPSLRPAPAGNHTGIIVVAQPAKIIVGGEARERPLLQVIDDQTGCPTPAEALAAAVVTVAPRLLAARAGDAGFGTFHFCGDEPVTWHGFAAAILGRLGRDGCTLPVLAPITTAEYPAAARRPAYSVLSSAKLAAVHGVMPPDWRPALERCLTRLQGERR